MSPRTISTPWVLRRLPSQLGRTRACTALPLAKNRVHDLAAQVPAGPTTSTGSPFTLRSPLTGREDRHGAAQGEEQVLLDRRAWEVSECLVKPGSWVVSVQTGSAQDSFCRLAAAVVRPRCLDHVFMTVARTLDACDAVRPWPRTWALRPSWSEGSIMTIYLRTPASIAGAALALASVLATSTPHQRPRRRSTSGTARRQGNVRPRSRVWRTVPSLPSSRPTTT